MTAYWAAWMGASRTGSITRLRTPWAWSSLKGLSCSHLATVRMSTLITLGRTLQVTCRLDGRVLYLGQVVDPEYNTGLPRVSGMFGAAL